MSTTYAVRDSATMLRRNLLHIRRYPSLSIMLVAQPILFLLLFVYVFGGTMGAGLPGHELVAVEDDLRAERRMPRHLDRHVPHSGSMMWNE